MICLKTYFLYLQAISIYCISFGAVLICSYEGFWNPALWYGGCLILGGIFSFILAGEKINGN
jgi:hypothetical protein